MPLLILFFHKEVAVTYRTGGGDWRHAVWMWHGMNKIRGPLWAIRVILRVPPASRGAHGRFSVCNH
ncbi:hypothetical protein SBA1_120009 [Candidatus Sulfotelmatobacter kueseliae]|uniref:Uncharacterized protein n=1 Tax=Candidatus Sulfotelmatobacter kueseliae TaxID=2042962 RepID=A0A2U3K255_9BACT|nr:hypothetical protein SBA1_120009 [Candidatus Sulfotelmatobacter kueseliae]